MPPPPPLTPVEAPSPLTAHRADGASSTLVVSLSGVGRRPKEAPPPEFVGTLRGRHPALFIADASRSWLNGPGVADASIALVRAEAERVGAARIAVIGDSMGGTNAIHLGDAIGADAVFAISPQVTADPAAIPEETRWLRWRRGIAEHKYRWVDPGAPAKPWRFMLHGGADSELIHALRMPWRRRQLHFVFPEHGHSLAAYLKRRRVLSVLALSAIEGRRQVFRRRAEAAGGLPIRVFDPDGANAARLGVNAGEATKADATP